MKIETLKNPASIVGALLLIFLGGYIAMSNKMSIGKDESKELSKTARLSIGIFVLLVGAIIMLTHIKKQSNQQ